MIAFAKNNHEVVEYLLIGKNEKNTRSVRGFIFVKAEIFYLIKVSMD